MNTDQKISVLKKFITDIEHYGKNQLDNYPKLTPQHINCQTLPEIEVLPHLMHHHHQIISNVQSTCSTVKPVLDELKLLQTKKQNVNMLLDSMTSIREVKKLSYGLGSSPSEIYRNLNTYFQIRDKLRYCDKYVEKVEEEIKKVQREYQQTLNKQLKKVNSDNVSEIAKTLNLINKHCNPEQSNSNQRLVNFYLDLLRKELGQYEDDLLKIPIVGPASANSYIFFDIAKDIMKCVVNTLNTYRNNIMKMGGEECLHLMITKMLSFIIEGIILEVLTREKKYFEMDGMDAKKMDKNIGRFKEYFKEFCAISNQIQRFKIHMSDQLPQTYPKYKSYVHDLENAINTSSLISLNSQAAQCHKIATRSLFNALLKKSPFVTSLWQFQVTFLENIVNESQSGPFESQHAHQFLTDTFNIFSEAIDKSFETLDVLIISSIISFANNNLIQEDSFHAFNQLFDRAISRFPTAQTKYYTAIITIINSVLTMPNGVRNCLGTLKIPKELETLKKRLQSELHQLEQVCEFKVKQTTNSFINSIIGSSWFVNELSDCKKALSKWKGFSSQANEIFLNRMSKVHVDQIINQEFNFNKSSKLLTQQGIIGFEKQVRNIISCYENSGCSVLPNFQKVLAYIEILLSQNEDTFKKLINNFEIKSEKEIDMLATLRNSKLDSS